MTLAWICAQAFLGVTLPANAASISRTEVLGEESNVLSTLFIESRRDNLVRQSRFCHFQNQLLSPGSGPVQEAFPPIHVSSSK